MIKNSLIELRNNGIADVVTIDLISRQKPGAGSVTNNKLYRAVEAALKDKKFY
jgi:hypothetical protein